MFNYTEAILYRISRKGHFKPQVLFQRFFALSLFATVFFLLLDFPIARSWITIGLSIYLILLRYFPSSWLIVLPALLPVLDLTPWSGRIFMGEFDLLVLVTCAAGFFRKDRWFRSIEFTPGTWLIILLLIVWHIYTTLIGLLPLQPIDGNSFTSYYSSYNSLRVAKGFFLALILLPLIGQAIDRGDPVAKLFSIGMIVGLSTGLSVIIWERALFPGIFDFDKSYRATGFFSSMAMGGAPIDAHLVISIPFTMFFFLVCERKVSKLFGLLLLALGLHGLAITYSRSDYIAVSLAATTALIAWRYVKNISSVATDPAWKKLILSLVALFTFIFLPVFSGQYLEERFSSTIDDYRKRIDHWAGSVEMMDKNWETLLFGMGKGVFPRTYLSTRPEGQIISTALHLSENNNSFVRFGKSDTNGNLFLRQRIKLAESGPYLLSINLRPRTEKKARLLIEICERIIFQSFQDCLWLGINTHADSTKWTNYIRSLSINGLGEKYWYGTRPIEVSLLNRGLQEGIDIDEVQIIAPTGERLLHNSSFESQMDHWFISSGEHYIWHIDNVWFHSFFEGGWIGLSVFTVFCIVILIHLQQRLKATDVFAIWMLSSYVGLLVVGFFDSLFDEPRIGLLFFLASWITLSGPTSYLRSNWGKPLY